jgi:hypothetical protein
LSVELTTKQIHPSFLKHGIVSRSIMRKNIWIVVPMKFISTLGTQARALLLAVLGILATTRSTQADQQIFTDSLQNGWQDWSWATHNLNNTTPVHSGTRSISVNAGGYTAVSFWHSPQIASAFVSLSFWIHGGTSGGQTLQVYAEKDGVSLPGVAVPVPTAGTWQQVTLSLASLGLTGATNMTRFNIQSTSGSTLPTFYLDDVSLISDITPPIVQGFNPTAGTVSALTNIVVIFSEAVTGINASDLRVNGNPANTMTGSGSIYSFTFNQPPEGVVNITWVVGHGITDLSSPANAFNATGPGATWQYTILDSIAPVITVLFPSGGATIAALSQIEVTFSETVLGVQAADLIINGSPATNVTKLVGQPYVFKFPPPPTGNVAVAWIPGHGITDGAAVPNAFAGGAWSYTLNPNLTLPDLVINEFLSSNVSTNGLVDEDGSFEDWIEIYNRGSQSVNLTNWSLSDDPALPGLWTFPARTLNPGQYLIVFASGKDRRPTSTSSNLHTNFKLSAGGEPLGLYSADSPRQLVNGFDPFPEQRNDVSYGRDLFGQLRYFATPTPGAANGLSTIVSIVKPVHVNVNRGHFITPFTLTASCPTPGTVLRYTTNGAEPTASSAVFPGSLQISNTTLFRIAGFKTDHLPARSETHSYLFNLPEAFRSLPVISIVTDSNNLWGPTGIMGFGPGYRNVEQHGLAWEKPISMEWIKPEDHSGFQVDCGVRIQGSDYNRDNSNADSKFSFRLYFRSDYGPGRLDYPLFENTTVESFDGLVLRAGFNEQQDPFIRDELHRRLSADMGQLASHGNMAIVLLNGNYYSNSAAPWILPVYNPTERVHAEFFQEHLGGSELWDVVKPPWQEGGGAVDGTFTDMANLVNYVDNVANVTLQADYTTISGWLDLTNFVDYLVLNTYAGMGDWPNNNWRAGRDQTGGPWRFVFWDAEWGMGIYGRSPTGINSFTDALNDASEIARLYRSLRDSAEFRLLWADRVQKHFYNGGALMGESITNRFRELETELVQFIPSMNPEILNWVANRWPTYLSHMTSEGLQSTVVAPSFNQHGGRVAPGFNLTITAPAGTIYYTTNGTDPRVAFTGAVSASALTYSGAITLNNTVSIRARALNGGTWSAINEATFTVGSLGIPLRITEIMYNPSGGSLYEFIELQNTSGVAVNLSGIYFDGINFIFPEGSSLAGGARLVLGANTDTNAWKTLYAGVNPAGWFSGSLNNAGERISLFDKFGNLITSVDYSDNGGWPTAADGGGRSLEVVNASGDPDSPANWKASAANHGTPGAANSAAPAQPVYLNEVMADNVSAVNNGGTFPDWIELRNPGGGSVNITGWSLSDDGNARKFVFPSTTISAGGYLTVWCDATTNTTPGLHTGFSLDKDGDNVFLYDATTNRIDALSFGLQVANKSVGRISSVWTLNNPTTNAVNVAATLAAASNLVLNEWLANPAAGLPDWIELFNNSASAPVALQGIYLGTSNNLHQLTALAFLAPKGYLQLFADEGVGPDHLDFKLPASGEKIVLSDATGGQIQSVTYAAQTEGVSQGRLPDGNSNMTNFVGSLSPETTNYINTYTGPVINEVLARNRSITVGTQIVDFVEIQNPNGSSFNLSGMSLSVNSQQAGEWIFPTGTSIAANSYLLIKCDGSTPASTNAGAFNTGESLDGESGGVYLFNTNNQVVNFVEYGLQVDNLSIGLSSGQWRLLTSVTPTAVNAAAAVLGNTAALRLNEWMPDAANGNDDWFELFNTTNRPVDLSAASLSDDPSLVGRGMFRPAPLSFIGPTNFVQWIADNNAGNGRNHVNFALTSEGESLLIYSVVNNTNFTLVDTLGFGAQTNGVSSGRLLDGATNILAFPGSESPGSSNYRLLQSVVINEALAHTDPPLEDAIEFRNTTASPVSINGWFLSNTKDNLRKYQITNTTPIPAGGYAVIYEYQFNNGTTNAFTLKAAYDDEIWLTVVTNSVETGERATVEFGASFNGVSFGRVVTSQGVDFVPLTSRSFGVDSPASVAQFRTGTGGFNAAPIIGPIVINEIMYNPPDGTNGSDEFIELQNNTASSVPLFDPAYPTNRWKLGGGIDFTFPASVSLAAGARMLVVDFNPTNTTTLNAFRARYGISNSVAVYGPFTGTLDNGGDVVKLYRSDTPQQSPAPDAGFVPYVIADRVSYTDTAPWPTGSVDGGGLSLQRSLPTLYGNEPFNWAASAPTPGAVFDTDGDGIPDDVELLMGLNPNSAADAALDPDGDGMTNYQEYVAGTSHTNASSNLKFSQISVSGNVTLTFNAIADKTYSVLYKNALTEVNWAKLADVAASTTNTTKILNDSLGGLETRFYRLTTPALQP